MYDLEYFFRTVHGFQLANGEYSTTLNGLTTDPGWLPVTPVELHLGNGLRYRVRVADLQVRHSIFNNRMVPVLSVVSFTCARYWDGTLSYQQKKTS